MPSLRETVLCHYHYDPLDRLISHALPDIPERQRFYCKSRLATEIQGAMRYSIVQHGDQLLGQQRSEGDVTDTTLLATDQQRSVLQTLKADRPPQPIAYSPYGHRPVESGLLSLLGFNGERPDPVTGCYLLGNGYRAFNPVLMRFNCPDSMSPFGKGGLNPYAYCLGDPTNKFDPSGNIPITNMIIEQLTKWANRARKSMAYSNSNAKRRLRYVADRVYYDRYKRAAFNKDLSILRSDANANIMPSNIKALERKTFREGPPTGQDYKLLLERIEIFKSKPSRTYDARKLEEATRERLYGNHPKEPATRISAARAYKEKIDNIRDPKSDEYMSEMEMLEQTISSRKQT